MKKFIFYSLLALPQCAKPCTGIVLKGQDDSIVFSRTLEWNLFDIQSKIAVMPRNYAFTSRLNHHGIGKKWTGQYGFVAFTSIGTDGKLDGMNEQGLMIGLFYHPGFCECETYNPDNRENTITTGDFVSFILSQCANISEVKTICKDLHVIDYEFMKLYPVPVHFMITDSTGQCITVEFTKGKIKIYDNAIGVLTNAPNFDWHMTNLHAYSNIPFLKAQQKYKPEFQPLGHGAALLGIPGDQTPQSRFVRAVALKNLARHTKNGPDTVEESFHILDSFNTPVPTHAYTQGIGNPNPDQNEINQTSFFQLKSGTQWTSSWDSKNKTLYYHTQHNRRLRRLDFSQINFAPKDGKVIYYELDRRPEQDVEDITKRKPS